MPRHKDTSRIDGSLVMLLVVTVLATALLISQLT
jgi:hypothetical protein